MFFDNESRGVAESLFYDYNSISEHEVGVYGALMHVYEMECAFNAMK